MCDPGPQSSEPVSPLAATTVSPAAFASWYSASSDRMSGNNAGYSQSPQLMDTTFVCVAGWSSMIESITAPKLVEPSFGAM